MKETRFKEMEVGMIPVEWKVKTIGEILRIGNGKDYKYLPFGNVPVYGTGGYMTSVSNYLYDGETVCIGRKGTIDQPQYHNGKIWTVDTLFYTYDFKDVVVKYLYYLFCTIDWRSHNEASGVPSLTSKNIYDIKIILPTDKKEQERIASALSNIDDLIGKLGRLIDKKRAIKEGAMQELLTGKKRLPGFKGEWVERKLGDIGSFYKGAGLSKEKLNKSGKYACMLYGEIFTRFNYQTDDSFNRTNYDEGILSCVGDVLLPGSTTTVGIDLAKAVCINDKDVRLGGDIIILRNDRKTFDSLFIAILLSETDRNKIAEVAQGTTIIHLHAKDLERVIYKMPSDKDEQHAIATLLNNMDMEIKALEAKRDKYVAIKRGMMEELLTGRIRLI